MAGKLKRVTDVFELLPDGSWQCRSCVYSTPHVFRARRHAQTEHLVEFEPVVIEVPKKGTPVEEFVFVEEGRGAASPVPGVEDAGRQAEA